MASFKVDVAAVNAFMASPDGPLMRRMLVIGDRVKAGAVARLKGGFPREFIGPQIVKRMDVVKSGPQAGPHVYIGASRLHTRPHPIEGNPLLFFFSKVHMHLISVRHVNHRGSDFTEYARKILLAALAAERGKI